MVEPVLLFNSRLIQVLFFVCSGFDFGNSEEIRHFLLKNGANVTNKIETIFQSQRRI